jgi:predicted nucleotidyltransferase
LDFKELKKIGWAVRCVLVKNHINPDIVILYGSFAKNKQRADSDIDLAIVSSDLGKDRFSEGINLNMLASQVDSRIEVVPIGIDEYFDPTNPNPLLSEIKATGISLF